MPLKRTVLRFPAALVGGLGLVLAPILLIAMSTSATGATGPRVSEPHTGSTCNGTLPWARSWGLQRPLTTVATGSPTTRGRSWRVVTHRRSLA